MVAQKLIAARRNDRGKLGMRIESHDSSNGKLAVLLFDPDDPSKKRRMNGTVFSPHVGARRLQDSLVAPDRESPWWVLLDGAKVLTPVHSEMPAFYLDFFTAPGPFAFRLNGSPIVAHQPGFPHPEQFGFEIALEPSDDPKLAAAANEAASKPDPPASLDPAGMVGFHEGVTYEGRWSIVHKGDLAKYAPGIDPATLDGPTHQGEISVRFEKIALDSREVSAVFSTSEGGKAQTIRRAGRLTAGDSGSRWQIDLNSLAKPAKSPSPAKGKVVPHVEPGELDFPTAKGYITLWMKDGEISGKLHPLGADDKHLWIELKLKPTGDPDAAGKR